MDTSVGESPLPNGSVLDFRLLAQSRWEPQSWGYYATC